MSQKNNRNLTLELKVKIDCIHDFFPVLFIYAFCVVEDYIYIIVE